MGYSSDSDDWWEEFHEPGGEYYDYEFEGEYGSAALRQHQEDRARRRALTKELHRRSDRLAHACQVGDAAEVTRIYDEGGPAHIDQWGNVVADPWSERNAIFLAIKYGHHHNAEVLDFFFHRGGAKLLQSVDWEGKSINSYLPTYWKRLFAVTLGRKHDVPELGGQRIAPLIGSFVVGDVLQVVVKKK